MIRSCLAVMMIAMSMPALAAAPGAKSPHAKAKLCPKGQVLLTSTITGKRYCGMPSVSMVGGGAQPVLLPPAPAKRPSP